MQCHFRTVNKTGTTTNQSAKNYENYAVEKQLGWKGRKLKQLDLKELE
jgi:hypothetical protein